ncbi:hypothetical protein EDC04DRAFT_2911092 [Pisolithus marmoratus]|nr:hypothetical protein EDC04DRAFT_2911092 [Pisolithus marmoratus]
MLLLTESTLFWLNLTWNALSAQESPNNMDKVQHWVNCVSIEKMPQSNGICPPLTSAVPPLTAGSTTFISSNPGLERKMLVPTYHMDAEELEDQPVSPIKVVAMSMDYDAEGDNEFDQPIYEVLTGLKCKQSEHDDNGYVTPSKVEDVNDGYEDHSLHFCIGPAKDLCVKMTNNGKKVKQTLQSTIGLKLGHPTCTIDPKGGPSRHQPTSPEGDRPRCKGVSAWMAHPPESGVGLPG